MSEVIQKSEEKAKDVMANRMQSMRSLLESQISNDKPVRKFTMPYQITASTFHSFEKDYQMLAIGLIDGAIIIIDLILGVEKYFLEKHPTQITSIAFYEDKSIISGSICGRVNVQDLENMEK